MKRVICLFLIVSMTIALCACSPFKLAESIIEHIEQDVSEQQQEQVVIGFSRSVKNSVEQKENIIDFVMTVDELSATENAYSKYCSGVIFNTLTEGEQTVFRALEYAMEHSYDRIFIDVRIMEDKQNAERIVEYLSFESPFLAQNVVYIAYRLVGYYDYTYSKNRFVSIPLRSTCISVENFTEKIWNQNELAFKQAKKIFSELDTGGSKLELIERLYTYVATNIEYESGAGKTRLKSYLYDALISKKTNCDGFSNALALLLSMAEVPNLEKCDTLDVEEGHTWNCFEWEGKWYNCDATGGSWIPKMETTMGPGLLFGFADYLQESEHDHFIRFPECKEPLYIKPTAELETSRGNEFFTALNDGFQKHNKIWVLVIVKEFDQSGMVAQAQRLANRHQMDLTSSYLELADGKTAILLCKDGLY
ncbi:MAG: transglutaminase domain-containing protein [Clostridia bacterium]|nr:transglutaminase domain-containing protein [Clostridia bacterium]